MNEESLVPDEPVRPKRDAGAIYRNIVMGVLAVSALTVVGLLGTLTWYAVTDHMAETSAAAEAKKTAVDKSALAKAVTAGLQNLVDTNDATKDAHFQYSDDLTLFQVVPGGSEYRGLMTAKSSKGTEVAVEVTAYADSNNGATFYEIDPSSNLRLSQVAEKENPKTCNSYTDSC